MAGMKSQQIKIYITIGLALVLIISGYFRVIRPRLQGKANASAPVSAAPVVEIPKVRIETPRKIEKPNKKQIPEESTSSMVRDIFSESVVPEPDPKEKEAENPSLPPITLKGTIVGGENPIAIINGKFLRIGDWLGNYRVVGIYKDEVLISSGKHEVVLEVLENVQN